VVEFLEVGGKFSIGPRSSLFVGLTWMDSGGDRPGPALHSGLKCSVRTACLFFPFLGIILVLGSNPMKPSLCHTPIKKFINLNKKIEKVYVTHNSLPLRKNYQQAWDGY